MQIYQQKNTIQIEQAHSNLYVKKHQSQRKLLQKLITLKIVSNRDLQKLNIFKKIIL